MYTSPLSVLIASRRVQAVLFALVVPQTSKRPKPGRSSISSATAFRAGAGGGPRVRVARRLRDGPGGAQGAVARVVGDAAPGVLPAQVEVGLPEAGRARDVDAPVRLEGEHGLPQRRARAVEELKRPRVVRAELQQPGLAAGEPERRLVAEQLDVTLLAVPVALDVQPGSRPLRADADIAVLGDPHALLPVPGVERELTVSLVVEGELLGVRESRDDRRSPQEGIDR